MVKWPPWCLRRKCTAVLCSQDCLERKGQATERRWATNVCTGALRRLFRTWEGHKRLKQFCWVCKCCLCQLSAVKTPLVVGIFFIYSFFLNPCLCTMLNAVCAHLFLPNAVQVTQQQLIFCITKPGFGQQLGTPDVHRHPWQSQQTSLSLACSLHTDTIQSHR